jgi:hypothetical protein
MNQSHFDIGGINIMAKAVVRRIITPITIGFRK